MKPTSDRALEMILKHLPRGEKIIDVGSGAGEHTKAFRNAGHNVTSIDLNTEADIRGNYLDHSFLVGCIWCAHVLEHQIDTNCFLKKLRMDLKSDGLLAITVPPMKPELVGGHLSLYTPLSLIYNMIIAGWDCSEAMVSYYGYNISVIVKKKPLIDLSGIDLTFGNGDLEKLSKFFPVRVKQNIHGFAFKDVNWKDWYAKKYIGEAYDPHR